MATTGSFKLAGSHVWLDWIIRRQPERFHRLKGDHSEGLNEGRQLHMAQSPGHEKRIRFAVSCETVLLRGDHSQCASVLSSSERYIRVNSAGGSNEDALHRV